MLSLEIIIFVAVERKLRSRRKQVNVNLGIWRKMMKAMIGDVVRVKRVDQDGKMYRCKATVMCVEEDGVMELLEGDKFSNRGKTMTSEGRRVFFEAKEVEALQDFERTVDKEDDRLC